MIKVIILFAKGSNQAKAFKIRNKSKYCCQTTQLEMKDMSSCNQSLHNGQQNAAPSARMLVFAACHVAFMPFVIFLHRLSNVPSHKKSDPEPEKL